MKRNGALFQIGIASEWLLLIVYIYRFDVTSRLTTVLRYTFWFHCRRLYGECATLQFYILFFSRVFFFFIFDGTFSIDPLSWNCFAGSCKYSSAFPCNNLYPAMDSSARNFNRCRIPLTQLVFLRMEEWNGKSIAFNSNGVSHRSREKLLLLNKS